jgi:hypothetical protein
MFEDQFSGELSEEQVFFRQLLMISSLATRIYTDVSTNWQVNIRNYVEAIKNFEASAIRHLDEEYRMKMTLIVKHAKGKIEDYRKQNPTYSLTDMGKEYEMVITLDVARKRLALIMRTLDNKGVFSEKSYRAVSEKKSTIAAPGETTEDDEEEIISIP